MVKNWLYKGVMPPAAKWTVKPCIELAYAIGVLHRGDGSVSKVKPKNIHGYHYVIQLAVIDPEFAITFSKMMSKLLGMNYHKPYWSRRDKAWCAAYDSKAFYLWYKKSEEQGLQGFKEYIEHNTETIWHYLKGLFDSDGNNYRNKRIQLSNFNKKLLEYVQYLLKENFDIIARGPYLQ